MGNVNVNAYMDGGSGEMAKEKLNKSFRKYKKNFIQTTFPFHSPIPLTALRAHKRETMASIFHFFFTLFFRFRFHIKRREAELSAKGREALKVKLRLFFCSIPD